MASLVVELLASAELTAEFTVEVQNWGLERNWKNVRFLPFSGSCASWIGLVDRTVPATILHDATLHTFEMDTVARYDSAKCPKRGMTKRAFYIS
mmetsp:Transcript_7189/g.8247  ORF Transcript_7189/g.8247 Transcript_7189/m.8247 type:complete len:94 (-) Transcript_7189:267-548(-)